MPPTELFTYADVIDALSDFTQGHAVGHPVSALRRNVLAAYREFSGLHDWSFLLVAGRVQLAAPQTTGTVVYDHTGGTNERELTLTGATWPTNAQDYSVRFDDIVCDIATRVSDTVVTLDSVMAPGADVTSTTYEAWPRWYLLPPDFVSMAPTQDETSSWLLGEYITPAEMHALTRYESDTGDIRYYTISSVPDLYGRMGLFVYPASNAVETLDFLYKRQLRPLRYSGKADNDKAGTITMTGGSTALTGSGTAFTSTHVGTVVRTAGNSSLPTGLEGSNPWVEQRSIVAVASATAATLDAAPTATRTGSKYTLSDPIDIEVAAYEAFLWGAKRNLARERRLKDLGAVEQAYDEALLRARASDSRTRHRRVAGPPVRRRSRLTAYKSRNIVP